MKILVLTHKLRVDIRDSLDECLDFIKENLPISFETDFKEVDFTLKDVRPNTLQYHGQYSIVIYAFDRKSQKKNNSDSWLQTKDMVLVQLCTGKELRSYLWADMAHEMMHSLCYLTGTRDVMDSYRENYDPRSKTGNFAEQFTLLQKHYMKYKYFSDKEIIGLQPDFVKKLDEARGYAGVPFVIISGFRDESKNESVGGVKDSAHLKGLAVDLKCPNSMYRFRMITALLKAGFNRIGINKTSIHVDGDFTLPQDVIWHYF